MEIVCRLGGFHTLMSFLGSIGTLMAGSGIEDALGQSYAENVVPHLMTGKAFARTERGNFFIRAVLMQKIVETFEESLDESELEELDNLLKVVVDGQAGYDAISKSNALKTFEIKLKGTKDNLKAKSRTAKFWLQYIRYINVVKLFIRAERTSNWNLHLVGKLERKTSNCHC